MFDDYIGRWLHGLQRNCVRNDTGVIGTNEAMFDDYIGFYRTFLQLLLDEFHQRRIDNFGFDGRVVRVEQVVRE